ncbi:MAG: YciI family protein [Pseudomonadota bacterium]
MAKFALLLPHAPDRYSSLAEDDYVEIIKDYVAWVERLAAEGRYHGGTKLTDEPGRHLRRHGDGDTSVELHDGPLTEVSEVLGGIMLIEAEDMDDAVAIARTCPHLVHNSHIEVRAVDPATED